MKTPVHPSTHLVTAFLSLLFLGLDVAAVRLSDIFGSPMAFALGVLAGILLILVALYSLARTLQTPFTILWSVLVSASGGVLENERLAQFRKRHRRQWEWVQRRLSLGEPLGLRLTVGAFVALAATLGFFGVAQDVLFKDPLTKVDQRVMNLVPSIRTPTQTAVLSTITFLANWQSLMLLAMLAMFILARKRQYLSASLIALATIADSGTVFVLKHLFGRARPEEALRLIREDGYSFPSGHVVAATLVYGMLAYLTLKSLQQPAAKLLTVLTYLTTVFLVALGRVYLGVHFPSDVLASVLLGSALLSALITAAEVHARYVPLRKQEIPPKALMAVPLLLVVWAVLAHGQFVEIRDVHATPMTRTLPHIDEAAVQRLPLYSETLTGRRMEPINFVYVGNARQIERLFATHGWYRADPATLRNTLRAFAAGFQNRQYLTAPVTPAFLNARPQDLAFEKPAEANTLRQRHHTRLWQTEYSMSDGARVWVATASFDTGVGIGATVPLPTHHIAPNVDAEREFIVRSLALPIVYFLQVVEPQLGKNVSGDLFFTDGRAAVVDTRRF